MSQTTSEAITSCNAEIIEMLSVNKDFSQDMNVFSLFMSCYFQIQKFIIMNVAVKYKTNDGSLSRLCQAGEWD